MSSTSLFDLAEAPRNQATRERNAAYVGELEKKIRGPCLME